MPITVFSVGKIMTTNCGTHGIVESVHSPWLQLELVVAVNKEQHDLEDGQR